MDSDAHEDVILIQLEGGLSSRTSASVKEVRVSMTHWSSQYALCQWQGMPGISGWAFFAQYLTALV